MSILMFFFKHGPQLLTLLAKGNTPGGSHIVLELLNNNKITLERLFPDLKQNDLFDDTIAMLKEQMTPAVDVSKLS